METIILVSAKKRHGKDTFLKILQEQIGEDVKQFMLAEKIKQMFCDYWSVDMNFVEDFKDRATITLTVDGKTVKKQTARSWLQNKGTEESQYLAGREVWCKILEPKLINHPAKIKVITDCRFIHEKNYFKRYHKRWYEFWKKPRRVISVKIFREGFVDGNDIAHASEAETEIIKPDYEIRVPDGRMDLFEKEVTNFVKAFDLSIKNPYLSKEYKKTLNDYIYSSTTTVG